MPLKPSRPKQKLPHILIVDDDAGQRSLLTSFLASQGFETTTADSGEQALDMLRSAEFDLMVSDVRMPGISGLETMRRARAEHPNLPILLVTAYADIRDAVGAIRDGAVNYLAKPIDLDELLATARKATHAPDSGAAKSPLERPLPDGVIARSTRMQTVFRDAALVAPSESRVLITGESGVGKEVVAEVIHAWSPRATGPMVKVNCAAIPEALLESELFGHEKGAFTGAYQQRIGRFEEAAGGTILLDEITELSPHLQAKLLRVTQDGRFQRVGSSRDSMTNARILAATNRDLDREVEKGTFREDLFYRLNVMEIYVPPLRERREDILALAGLFVAQFTRQQARFSPSVSQCLERYPWPGNVRELRNAMERATLVSRGELILPEHLPARILETQGTLAPADTEPSPDRLEDIEREAILQSLRDHNYSRTEAARALGISRRTLTYKTRRLREMGYQVDPEA